MRKSALAIAVAALCSIAWAAPAQAQSDPYIGQVMMTGANFCPVNWAPLEGQLLPISENETLFALLGTTYGGDGQNTFGVPDMRGRRPVGEGTGLGGGTYVLGQQGGTETRTLTVSQIPVHTHVAAFRVANAIGNSTTPVNTTVARLPGGSLGYTSSTAANFLKADSVVVNSSGGGQPFSIMTPFLAVKYCIALFGIFPPQS